MKKEISWDELRAIAVSLTNNFPEHALPKSMLPVGRFGWGSRTVVLRNEDASRYSENDRVVFLEFSRVFLESSREDQEEERLVRTEWSDAPSPICPDLDISYHEYWYQDDGEEDDEAEENPSYIDDSFSWYLYQQGEIAKIVWESSTSGAKLEAKPRDTAGAFWELMYEPPKKRASFYKKLFDDPAHWGGKSGAGYAYHEHEWQGNVLPVE